MKTITQKLFVITLFVFGLISTAQAQVVPQNSVWTGPLSGSGFPSWRALTDADLPTIPLSGGGTGASLTASNGAVIYSTAGALALLTYPSSVGECLLSGQPPTWGACNGPNPGVSTVGNASADNTLTITGTGSGPWSGNVTVKCTVATSSQIGCNKPDGTIITDVAGAITVAKASSSAFGVVEVDGTTIQASAGVISINSSGIPTLAGNNAWTGNETHSGTETFTNAAGISINKSTATCFNIRQNPLDGSFPVETMYPCASTSVMFMDISPHGAPSDGGFGVAVTHTCGADVITGAPIDCVGVAAGANGAGNWDVYVYAQAFNGGTAGRLIFGHGAEINDVNIDTNGLLHYPSIPSAPVGTGVAYVCVDSVYTLYFKSSCP